MLDITMEVLVDYPGISVNDVRFGRRTRKVCEPRAVAMYEVKKQRPDLSYPAIGRWFGGRDHTTVLYSVRKIEAQRGEA
ncbi:helix-turn-helix domain-containing protein [Rhizobium sp. AC44/96]|uniref:helix-turn-helix domain-containing protein n=1 Tax=Rhizobium sp. AC44/96 TaxID=1841654 RepID=UPI0023AB27F8|nr:helix-turn-helix domain-containing protein [Rhizobium sp. AC44/96]